MKRIAILALAALVASGRAETEVVDGVEWTYTVSGGVATIGNSVSPAISVSTTGAISVPSAFGVHPVKAIGENAFSGCSGLTSVAIPEGVASIGRNAFNGCFGLTSVSIPDSVTIIWSSSFYECPNLYDTNSVPGIRIVDGWAVGHEDSLSGELVLPCVRGFANYALQRCSGLTNVVLPDNLRSVVLGMFAGCSELASMDIPDGVTEIGNCAFQNCPGLSSVSIPASVTNIGLYAFCQCTGLASVFIPGNVREICQSAFADCTGLSSVSIPGSVRKIGNEAFSGCRKLTSVSIPFGVVEIGAYAFYNCTNLTAVSIPSSMEIIQDFAFYGCPLQSVSIPEGVKTVGDKAFYPGKIDTTGQLGSVSLPDSLENLGFRAFGYQEPSYSGYAPFVVTSPPREPGLVLVDGWVVQSRRSPNSSSTTDPTTAVDLTNVRGVASEAFRYARNLTECRIPDGLKGMGDRAFLGCRNFENGSFVGGWLVRGEVDGVESVRVPTETDRFRGIASWTFAYGRLGSDGRHSQLRIDANCGAIGFRAFSDSAELESLVFDYRFVPQSYNHWPDVSDFKLTKIACQAFVNCSNLRSMATTVTVVDDEQTGHCTVYPYMPFSLDGMSVLPPNVRSVEYQAFRDCTRLNFDSLSGLLNVGPHAFSGCSDLRAQWQTETDSWTVAPDALRIGMQAFRGCTNLSADALPRDLLGLGWQAFEGTSSLRTNAVTGVVSVGDWAVGCTAPLSGALDLSGFRGIGDRAFAGCTGLTAVSIPDETRFVGRDAFSGCEALFDTETVPGAVLVDGWVVGRTDDLPADLDLRRPGVRGIAAGAFAGCTGLVSVSLPVSFTGSDGEAIPCNIGDYAFAGCTGLRSVVIPSSSASGGRTIGNGAFIGCTGLTAVFFQGAPEESDVTVVGNEAFSGCAGVKTIAIPPSVRKLGTEVFRGCRNLETVYLPRALAADHFGTTSNGDPAPDLAVPAECEVVYGADFVRLSVFSARGRAHPVGTNLICGLRQTVYCSVEVPEGEDENGEVYRFMGGFGDPWEWPPTTNGTICCEWDGVGFEWFWLVRQTIRLEGEADWGWSDGMIAGDDNEFWAFAGHDNRLFFTPSNALFQCDFSGDADGVTVDFDDPAVVVPGDGPRTLSVRVVSAETALASEGKTLSWSPAGSGEPWRPFADGTAADGWSLRSGAIEEGGTSSVETSVSGSGTLSFKWKVSDGGSGFVRAYLDGVQVAQTEQGAEWRTVSVAIPEGTHVVRWSYERGSESAESEGAAFLDDVLLRPVSPLLIVVW